ncbi:MAG: hypothetical protein HY655_05020 [Acidobacteria bacterium]|nr:hypothetical protein [Acidobacteriota bacterium]
MTVVRFLLLILLIPVTSFAPGFFLVRRIRRWAPLEKLTASVGASIVLIYLAAFAIYDTMISWRLAWVFTAASVLALAVCWHDARRLFAAPQVRRVTRLFGGLFFWNLLMLAVIRNYIGGFWGPDWYEHYERATFFVERGPDLYEFIDLYLLPARPPLMNLVSAFFLAQTGTAFANYQLTSAFLNLLPFVPLVLLSSLLVRRATRHAALLGAVLACNPMFLHNAQFSWTKGATGFFIALALWFYLVGWRRQDPLRMSLAFLSLSAGTLIHYSAAPYALVIGLHYVLWVLRSRQSRWKGLAGIAVPSALLLATWFGYSLAAYGVRETLTTNTAVTDARRLTLGENASKIAANIVDTLVPAPVRGYWVERDDNTFRRFVDNAFYLYQVNLPFAFGLGGSVLVLFLIVRGLGRPDPGAPRRERAFWRLFIAASAVLGIAAHGARDYYGLAHIGLQPLVQLGLAWLAASLPTLSRTLRGVALAGMAIDFVLGVAIHVYLETLLVDWASDYNLELKNKVGVVFLGDWLPALSLPLQWAMWALFAALVVRTYRTLDRLRDVDAWTARPRWP